MNQLRYVHAVRDQSSCSLESISTFTILRLLVSDICKLGQELFVTTHQDATHSVVEVVEGVSVSCLPVGRTQIGP